MKNRGFIAITTVLIIGFILVLLGTSVTLASINSLQIALSDNQKTQANYLALSCVEAALWNINQTKQVPTTHVFPEFTCTYITTIQTNTDWTFTTTVNWQTFYTTLETKAHFVNNGNTYLLKVDYINEKSI